ncbi:MAG: (2Fe-2S)-binding protein [Candidatus Marinimicrobia bacterium]|nr:(2Fe-2S)-binding protein [Candidatus Neomarinimicrobiota bacterium]
MPRYALTVNGEPRTIEANPDDRLLWIIRDTLGLTGTKYSCGMSQCGACTVLVDGAATHSCSTSIKSVAGKSITTIEGLSDSVDHPLQKAWLEWEVAQCGYCQSGQIMAAAALLKSTPRPSDNDIDAAMSKTLCRCGTYQRIRHAIHSAAKEV